MKAYTARIKGVSPMSQSAPILTEREQKETADAHEKRCWRERLHTKDGFVSIPPMAIKNCLSECAKYLSIQIPGKGKSTYTKHFEAGILVLDQVVTNVAVESIKPEKLFVPADGKRGSGKRVWKYFPMIPAGWQAEVTIYVADETITGDVLEEHLKQAGMFIGVGRFRPRNNGFYGRFELLGLKEVL
jgi:hypothetical protein